MKNPITVVRKALSDKPIDRIDKANVIFEEHGLVPVLNVRDLETRRTEIKEVLEDIEGKTLTDDMEKDVVEKTFRMFFMSGSAWIRGLDNPQLSKAVSSFLALYKRIGYLPHAPKHLFVCAMNLLHYSFMALDVTNTPVYMMHVIQPNSFSRPVETKQDPTGTAMLQAKIQELEYRLNQNGQ